MDTALIQSVLDAGIGVVAIVVISYLFHQMMKSHRAERQEWRESSEKQTDKVSKAIEDLAHSINEQRDK